MPKLKSPTKWIAMGPVIPLHLPDRGLKQLKSFKALTSLLFLLRPPHTPKSPTARWYDLNFRKLFLVSECFTTLDSQPLDPVVPLIPTHSSETCISGPFPMKLIPAHHKGIFVLLPSS